MPGLLNKIIKIKKLLTLFKIIIIFHIRKKKNLISILLLMM